MMSTLVEVESQVMVSSFYQSIVRSQVSSSGEIVFVSPYEVSAVRNSHKEVF